MATLFRVQGGKPTRGLLCLFGMLGNLALILLPFALNELVKTIAIVTIMEIPCEPQTLDLAGVWCQDTLFLVTSADFADLSFHVTS
jgi:hypothetical protein